MRQGTELEGCAAAAGACSWACLCSRDGGPAGMEGGGVGAAADWDRT